MARFDVNAALKAGYTQSEIDDFMKKNGAVAPGQPDNEVARSLTSLENIPIIGSLLSPATKAVRFAGETGAQAVRTLTDPAFRKVAFDPKSLTPDEAAHIQASPKTFLMPEAQIATPLDIVKNGARATAGAASYAIPVGPGLGGAVLSGGAMGALSAASDDNSNLASIGAGGAGGAVGGGLVYGAGQAIQGALRRLGKDAPKVANAFQKTVQDETGRVYVDSSVGGAAREQAIQKTLSDLKIAGGPQKKYEMLQPAMHNISNDIQDIISKDPKSMAIDDIVAMYQDKLTPSLRTKDLTNKQAALEARGYIADLIKGSGVSSENKLLGSQSLSGDELFRLKTLANGDYQSIVKKIASGSPLTPREKVIKAGRDTLDSVIATLYPEVKSKTIQQSHLFDAAESFGAQRKTVPTFRIAGTTAPAIIKEKIQEFAGDAGRGAVKLGTKLEGLRSSKISTDALQKVMSLLGSGAASSGFEKPLDGPVDQTNNNNTQVYNKETSQQPDSQVNHNSPIVPQTGDMVQIYDNQEKKTISVPRSDLAKYGITEGQDQAPQADKGMGGLSREQISKAMILDLATTGGKHIAELKTLAEFVAPPKEKALSNSAENRQQLGQSGLRGLDEVEALLKEGGVDPVFLSSLPGSLGARQYDSAAFRAVEGLLRARSGAAIPEQEVRRYMNANLPRVGDSETTRKAKLKAFRLDLEGVANSKSQGDFMLQQ